MKYRNLIVKTRKLSNIPRNTFHDDEYSDDNVKVLPFPFMDLFSDFRLFNQLPLEFMDEQIGKIREIMIDIANAHAEREDDEANRKE